MKKVAVLLIFFFVSLFSISIVDAHPGRTASDGCHYCRTNCDKWGVLWNQRHCHGGGSAPAPVKTYPTSIPVVYPTSKPIVYPTTVPTRIPTHKPLTCSDSSDNACPDNCTVGNDYDCCDKKNGYSWYDNWGCYPERLNCSAQKDNICNDSCTPGNDYDCCYERLENYEWYEGWGCYLE